MATRTIRRRPGRNGTQALQRLLPPGARVISGGYKGARRRSHNELWQPTNKHPDSEIIPDIYRLRARSRALGRDAPLSGAFLQTLEDNVVGMGIRPEPKATFKNGKPHEQVNEAIALLWRQMEDVFDLQRQLSIYGLQGLALRSCAEGGAGILHLVSWTKDAALPVPLQVYGVEPDYLWAHEGTNRQNNNEIRQGVELDKQTGRPVAFWIAKSNRVYKSTDARRIPAEDITYLFRRDRWGQVLGVPWFAITIDKLRDLDEYEDAEVVRARFHAVNSDYIKTPFPKERMDKWSTQQQKLINEEADGTERIEEINLGMRTYLLPGEEVSSGNANIPPGNFADFVVQGRRAIAVGLGVSYETLTGDHTKTHFSASRATWLRDVRRFRVLQAFLVWHVCRPIYERLVDVAVMTGKLPIARSDYFTNPEARWRLLRCEWRPPGFAWHDPVKDIEAARIGLALGITTRTEICAQRGLVFEDVVDRLAAEEAYMRERGLEMVSAPGDLKILPQLIGVEPPQRGDQDNE